MLASRAKGALRGYAPLLKGLAAGIGLQLSTSLTRSGVSSGALREVDILLEDEFGELSTRMKRDLEEFVAYEYGFARKLVDTTLTTPSIPDPSVVPLVMGAVMLIGSEYLTVDSMLGRFTEVNRRQLRGAVRTGLYNGQSPAEVGREVRRVINTRTTAQMGAVMNTGFTHLADATRNQVFTQNTAMFSSEEWVAVLDNRTSAICRALDGQQFPVNEGQRPPAHYNCRSIRVPIPYARSIRDEFKGDAPKGLTYQTWLERQPVAVQNQVLGKSKAVLFRKGGLQLTRFVSPRGREYTLEDLRALEPLAFTKAGL